jgi:peptide chain release factor subunit 1
LTNQLTVPPQIRALAGFRTGSREGVLSMFLDLDPSEFAVPKARIAEVESLTDRARQRYTDDEEHRPPELDSPVVRLVERTRLYLEQEFAPQGALGVAVFAAEEPSLFDVFRLHHTVEARVVVARRPFVRPLLEGPPALDGWVVLMVNRRTARLLAGRGGGLEEVARFADEVHGWHDQGGWSQPQHQRHIEKQVKDHVRHASEALFQYSRQAPVDRVVLAATEDVGPLVEGSLHADLARALAGRVRADIETARPADLDDQVMELAVRDREEGDGDLMERLGAGLAQGDGATAGREQVLDALNLRSVDVLLACRGLAGAAVACPTCGWLGAEGATCPIDGSATDAYDDLLEAMVETSLDQAAGVRLLDREVIRAHDCVAALLRFPAHLSTR